MRALSGLRLRPQQHFDKTEMSLRSSRGLAGQDEAGDAGIAEVGEKARDELASAALRVDQVENGRGEHGGRDGHAPPLRFEPRSSLRVSMK
jgi:hypothetical protein